jgi:hypothetical protein
MSSRWAIVAVALLATGCGERVIDSERAEGLIRASPGLRVPIAAADCPEGVALEEGATFECRVRYENGSEEAWTLEQLDDEGTVRAKQVLQTKLPDDRSEVRIIPENVEVLIAQSATKPLEDVDCPKGIALEKGGRFKCVASFRDGTSESVTIVQRDDLGNVEVVGSRPLK